MEYGLTFLIVFIYFLLFVVDELSENNFEYEP
jgi:hypothetical protein